MKKYILMIKSFAFTLALAMTSIFIIQSCDLNSLGDGLELYVDTDIVASVASIQVIDANETADDIAGEIEVEILGQDADKVYSLLGESDITVVAGMINLAVKKTDIPTPDEPLRFYVRTKADGYLTGLRSFVIENDSVLIENISMVNLSAPPSGVSVATGTLDTDANGTTVENSFSSPLDNGKLEKADIVVPVGTKMFDESGNELTGTVNLTMTHFDERSESSLNAFPGGFDADDIVDENGNDLGEGMFSTAGFTTINMDVNGQSVKTFSQPINVTMSINADMVNPITGNPIAVGDTIPIWSIDGGSTQWKKEGDGVVQDNSGTLEIQFLTDHLSSYNLDWYFNSCRLGVNINITSNVNSWSSRRFSQLVDASTGRVYRTMNESFRNGSTIRLYRAPRNRLAKIKVYEGNWYCKTLVAESQAFDMCGSTVDVDFSQLSDPTTLRSYGYLQGQCNGTNLNVYSILYYRDASNSCNSNRWSFLGRIYPNGRFYTRTLELNKTYDFKLRVGRETIIANDVTLTDQVNATLPDGTVVSATLPPGNNNLQLIMTNIPIPANICAAFGG